MKKLSYMLLFAFILIIFAACGESGDVQHTAETQEQQTPPPIHNGMQKFAINKHRIATITNCSV